MYKVHHPKADIDRLYVKRKGGRGLLPMGAIYKAQIINNGECFNTKCTEDKFINIVKSHESNQPNMNSAKTAKELKQLNEKSDTKQEGTQHIQAKLEVACNLLSCSPACGV
jgi:hypothetical protein